MDVVIHSYRHRFGNAEGDPRYADVEARLATLPKIGVPTITLHGAVDGVHRPQKSEQHGKYFTGRYQRRLLENVRPQSAAGSAESVRTGRSRPAPRLIPGPAVCCVPVVAGRSCRFGPWACD